MVIPREAQRITNLNELKNTLVLSNFQKDVLIGTILGDASLDGEWKNYRLVISHSVEQKEYVEWKYGVFREWTLQGPTFCSANNSLRFRTISHPELTCFRKMFYAEKKKIIPKNIGNLLNPLTLAVWYMDDGNIRKQNNKIYGYYLNTQSFSFEENRILSKTLEEKFGLETYVLKNKGKHRLYFGSKSKIIFSELIKKYILPSLRYKIR